MSVREIQTFEVEAASRDWAGRVMALCGSKPFAWSVPIFDLVDDIEGGRYRYVVAGSAGPVEVVVALTEQGKIVCTDPAAGKDLLAGLPAC